MSKIVELGRRAEKLVSNIRVWFWRSPSIKYERERIPPEYDVSDVFIQRRDWLGFDRKSFQRM